MATFDLTRLYGGRTKFVYPGRDAEGNPMEIAFWANHPTELVRNAAGVASGLVDSEGDVIRYTAQEETFYQLALHCVCSAENLEGWPEQAQVTGPSGWPVLSDEALDCLPFEVRRYILTDIGKQLIEAAVVSEEEGNESTPQPSGLSTETASADQTEAAANGSQTAPSAETQSSAA